MSDAGSSDVASSSSLAVALRLSAAFSPPLSCFSLQIIIIIMLMIKIMILAIYFIKNLNDENVTTELGQSEVKICE
jgi:hypothetical protein